MPKTKNRSSKVKKAAVSSKNKRTGASRPSFINKLSLLQRRQAIIFVLFFGLVGATLLYLARAETPFGSVPVGADEIVVRYSHAHDHETKKTGFNESDVPAMLLYGNGTMLCSTEPEADNAEKPAVFRTRQLSPTQRNNVFNKLLSLGLQQAAEVDHGQKMVIPTRADTITLNSTNGALTARKFIEDTNAKFDALAAYLNEECAAATEAYEPPKVHVETYQVPESQDLLQSLTAELQAVLSNLSAQLTSQLADVTDTVKSLTVQGQEALDLRKLIPSGEAKTYRLNGKLLKSRLIPEIPAYKPVTEFRNSKNTVDAQSNSRSVRWIYLIPADGPAATSADQSYINEHANSIRDWYTRETGKTFSLAGATVMRGKKTTAQYQVCPTGMSCVGSSGQFMPHYAVVYNIENELKESGILNGFSTNVFYKFRTPNGCYGTGSAPSGYGFSAMSSEGCNWYDASHTIGAHEAGHTFGLPHVCDDSLMGNCIARPAWPNVKLSAQYGHKARVLSSPYFNGGPTNPNPPNPPSTSPTLTINVVGAPGNAANMTSVGYGGPAYTIGNCTSTYGATFSVSGSRTCSGSRFGPFGIMAQAHSNHNVTWSGCTGGVSPTNAHVCNMAFWDTNNRTITATYRQVNNPVQGALSLSYFNWNNYASVNAGTINSINFNWGQNAPAAGIGADRFQTNITGSFRVPQPGGNYRFFTTQDDFALLKVNGTTVLNAWNSAPGSYSGGPIRLNAGTANIEFAHYDAGGAAYVTLYWEGPGISGRQIFPNIGGSTSTPAPAKNCNVLLKLLGLCK